MSKWTDYAEKEGIADNDEIIILDKETNTNKRSTVSNIVNGAVEEIASHKFSGLNTADKTIVGAINGVGTKNTEQDEKISTLESVIKEAGTKNTEQDERIGAVEGKLPSFVKKTDVDSTLSVSGSPADAKAVGDAVGLLKEDLSYAYELVDERTDINGEYKFIEASLITYENTPKRIIYKGSEKCIILTSDGTTRMFEFNVKPFEKYKIVTTLERADLYAILFVNDDYIGISSAQKGTGSSTIYNIDVTVPIGATKCIVNTSNNTRPNSGSFSRNTIKKKLIDKLATKKDLEEVKDIVDNFETNFVKKAIINNEFTFNSASNSGGKGIIIGEPISTTNFFNTMYNTLIYDKLCIASRIRLSNDFTHDSTIGYKDGKFYITCSFNSVDLGDSANEINCETHLFVVTPDSVYTESNSSTKQIIENITIAKHNDDVLGSTIDKGAGNPNQVIIGNIVRCMFYTSLDSVKYFCYRDYDIATQTLKDVGRMTLDGTENSNWWMNGSIATDGKYYYGTLCRGDGTSTLVRSTDCISWNTIANIDSNAQFEVSTCYFSDRIYTATRVIDGIIVRKLSINGVVETELHINCSNSRPMLFVYKNILYLIFNGYNRRKMYICYFSNNKWSIIAESDYHNIYPSVVVVGDEIYMSSTQNSSTGVYVSIVSHLMLDNTPMNTINILNNALKLTDLIKK